MLTQLIFCSVLSPVVNVSIDLEKKGGGKGPAEGQVKVYSVSFPMWSGGETISKFE